MKNQIKIILTFVFLGLFTGIKAQDYTPFEWDILRIGYAIPSGEGVGGGFALGSEARYNINNNLSAGLRAEFAIFASDSELVDIGASGSYVLVGDYYFSNAGSFRAFGGLGIGLYGGGTSTVGGTEVEGGSSIGVCPRLGYEVNRLRLSVEYNLPFKEEVPKYLGIHAAFTIGGGYED